MIEFNPRPSPSPRYPDPASRRGADWFSDAMYPGTPRPDRVSPPPIVVALTTDPVPRFPVGRLMITPAAAQVVPADEAAKALRRHASGDWGNVDSEDWAANDAALRHGTRLLSSYTTQNKTVFWVITEADRSVTTILLPSDY
jgi:hypothetical protein